MENEADWACSTHGIYEKCIQNLNWNTYLSDIGVGGRMTLKWILKN
jgi:hypothetical protein